MLGFLIDSRNVLNLGIHVTYDVTIADSISEPFAEFHVVIRPGQPLPLYDSQILFQLFPPQMGTGFHTINNWAGMLDTFGSSIPHNRDLSLLNKHYRKGDSARIVGFLRIDAYPKLCNVYLT